MSGNSLKKIRIINILRIIISSLIVVITSFLFKRISIFNMSLIKLRPEYAFQPVLGLYFGLSGAVGAGIGSIINNFREGTFNVHILIFDFFIQMFYAYVPFKLWYTFRVDKKCEVPNLNNINSIVRYIYFLFIDFVCVYVVTEISHCNIYGKKISGNLMLINIFDNFNYVVMIGIAILIAVSTTNVKPHIPNVKTKSNKIVHFEYIIYIIILIEMICTYINLKMHSLTYMRQVISAAIGLIFILMLTFIILPIINNANAVEISKMKGVFSLKGKVTISFLVFSIMFISILEIVTNIALKSSAYITVRTYIKINTLIGISGYVVFVITLLVLHYVQNKITKPIHILFNAVEDFTKSKNNKNIDQQDIIKRCGSIKTGDEIEELAIAFGRMMNDLDLYVKNLSRATAKIEKEAAELSVARKIQASMLPDDFPAFPDRKEFDIFASMIPAKEVSGDFYDFFMADENTLVFVIADVSGKGVPAALFMMTAKTTIKNLINTKEDITKVIERVNNDLCENNDTFMFVTCFIAVVDLKNGVMTYINAGHNPPLMKRKSEEFDYLNVKNNCILAIIPEAEFEKQVIKLKSGDIIFAYTDGVTEAMNSEGNLFGISRLKEGMNLEVSDSSSIYDIIPLVKNDIDEYCTGEEQSDDITMLVFKYYGK